MNKSINISTASEAYSLASGLISSVYNKNKPHCTSTQREIEIIEEDIEKLKLVAELKKIYIELSKPI